MREIPCPTCGGARLKPEVLAVRIGERPLDRTSCHRDVERGGRARVPRGRRACSGAAAHIAGPIVTEIEARLEPSSWTWAWTYLTLARAAGDALRRRGAAHPPGHADRRAASSACSTSSTSLRIGLHQRDNEQAHRNARAPARLGQHRSSSLSTTRTRCGRPTVLSTLARARASTAARSCAVGHARGASEGRSSLTGRRTCRAEASHRGAPRRRRESTTQGAASRQGRHENNLQNVTS